MFLGGGMRDTEQQILTIFKQAAREISAEDIAKELYPEEYQKITQQLESSDKNIVKKSKAKKFQLHRKILYYLNKLEEQHIIRIARIEEKGEKLFALAIDEGELILEKGYKKIIITKTALPASATERYEQERIMKRYEQDTFITNANAILLECASVQGISKLYAIIRECFNVVNDVVALNDFEIMIMHAARSDEEDPLKEFLQKLSVDTEDLNKTVSLIITLNGNDKNIIRFIKQFTQMNPRRINIIFNLTSKTLHSHSQIFEEIVALFSKEKIKINIKNTDIAKAPYLKGRAGMYSIDDEDWETYCAQVRGKTIGVCCSQSAIAININHFFEKYHTDAEFRKGVLAAAKLLLSANTLQRRKLGEYFRNINMLNGNASSGFYRFSRNYIRFWNYDWQKNVEEDDTLFDLLKSTKEVIDHFCYSEETIFKSCGIPIRFRIAFSSAFRNFDPQFMGEREYKKANIRGIEDYYKQETKEFIYTREKMFEIFDGGDRLRIFRTAEFNTKDIIHEFSHIISSYKIPFFTYDFSGMRGMIRLTNYI